MKARFLTLILMSLSLTAQAAFVATKTGTLKKDQPAHILIAGVPEKLGELFVYSALTKARLYQEKSPTDQIVILGRDDDKERFLNAGYKVIGKIAGEIDISFLEEIVEHVNYVKSLDVFAHSNALSGIIVDKTKDGSIVLGPNEYVWKLLKAKVKSDSFIMFHGCNSGLVMAPAVAKTVGVVTLGSLNGTDFQTIYSDTFWAHDYNGKKELRSEKNTISFNLEASCAEGYCTRMKPDNAPYKGYWGDWTEGGYPTYKIFCGSNNNPNCGAGAVEAVKSFPSTLPPQQVTSLSAFKEIVQDFLCPFGHNQIKQVECIRELESSLVDSSSTYSPFSGKTLNCDMEKCSAHFQCDPRTAATSPGDCKLINEKPGKNSTVTNEYRFLIQSFKN